MDFSKYKIKNKKIINITKNGVIVASMICLVSVLILEMYCSQGVPQAFYIGISLLRAALFYIAMFIICGYVFDK